MREVAAEFERPALLFSGGKDSICLLRLAEKAFRPSDLPMPLLNVDTGHHFPELNEFRDRRAAELGAKLIVRTVDDAIANGIAVLAPGQVSRNRLQIPTLLAAIEEFRFDCCIGGARRDEEKARAKERFFSFRDAFGQWDPKNQRPEIWNLYNAGSTPAKTCASFRFSNWTETGRLGVHPARSALKCPRSTSAMNAMRSPQGQWLPVNDLIPPKEGEDRSRNWWCACGPSATSSAPAVSSRPADNVDDIIAEIAAAAVTERGSRADDKASATPPWRTGRRLDIFSAAVTIPLHYSADLLRFNTCGSVDDGKSTLDWPAALRFESR